MNDKNELFEDLSHLETALADTYAVVGTIKDALQDAISENVKLSQENDRLRVHIEDLEAEQSGGEDSSKAKKKANLMRAYEEGFHVCRPYYGKILEEGENCLLCQEVLFR